VQQWIVAFVQGFLIDLARAREDYSDEKTGFYQRLENNGKFEIRVQTGRVGFKKEFENLYPQSRHR
jgi:hypothetical protein